MGRKAGRKPKYRSEGHDGTVQDYGPMEIWNKSVVVRSLGAEAVRHEISGYVLRSRVVAEGGMVVGAGTFNEIQCPLDGLMASGYLGRGELAERRFQAGEALFELWKNADIGGRTTATWGGSGGSGGVREQDDSAAEDEMRYHRAVKAIRPYDALVMAVCVQHIVPPGRARAIEALNAGLDVLALHFEKPRTTSIRHEKRVG